MSARPRPEDAASNDAGHGADIAISAWTALEATLSPIIGQRGFAALYKRSLHRTRGTHACLNGACELIGEPDNFGSLCAALSAHANTEAMAAHRALFGTFRDLLTSLIGESLTTRLLQPILDNPSSGHAVQDNSP